MARVSRSIKEEEGEEEVRTFARSTAPTLKKKRDRQTMTCRLVATCSLTRARVPKGDNNRHHARRSKGIKCRAALQLDAATTTTTLLRCLQ